MVEPGGKESSRYIAHGMSSVGSAGQLCPTDASPQTPVEWLSSNSRRNQQCLSFKSFTSKTVIVFIQPNSVFANFLSRSGPTSHSSPLNLSFRGQNGEGLSLM